MERIQVRENREEAPLPCDYFDLIGGTGTEGLVVAMVVMSSHLCTHTRSFSSLIALMLGRLGMPVEKAVRCYGTLVGSIGNTNSELKHSTSVIYSFRCHWPMGWRRRPSYHTKKGGT